MIIVWENIAQEQLEEVANYIENGFGLKYVRLFQQDVLHTTELLLLNPYLGALEPLLSGRSKEYRSILANRLDKMVYYVDENTIHIVAFWDCRREPGGQTKHLV